MDEQSQAQRAFRNRDFATAETLLLQILESNPEDGIVHMRLGQVYMALGDFEKCFQHLRNAQRCNPKNPDVYRSLGMAIRMSGSIDLGISYLGTMLTYAPLVLQPQVHLTLAELFAVKGEHTSLLNSLLLLEKLPPSNNPRMELRLWNELKDTEGMKRLSFRYPQLEDLCKGFLCEESDERASKEYWLRSSCREMWEADLGLYRITNDIEYLYRAQQKAPKTSDVIAEVAKAQGDRPTLEKLSQSPVVFQSIRLGALQFLEKISTSVID